MIAQDETAPTEAPAETGDMDFSDIKKKKKKELPMDLVRGYSHVWYAPLLTHTNHFLVPCSCALRSIQTGRG